jgi:hypothetical protein
VKPVIELADLPIMGRMIVFIASGTVRTKAASVQIGEFSATPQELSRAAA